MYILCNWNAGPRFVGRKIEVFRIRFDDGTNQYVRDPNGPSFGIIDPATGKIAELSDEPEMFGEVTEE